MTDHLHVVRAGSPSSPTLLLLHGFSDSAECWHQAVPRWSHDWYVVVPDARGHGTSPRWDDVRMDARPGAVMVDDVVALLHSLVADGGSPRAVLVGHSMGAAVAAAVAASEPDLVAGVVLEDPPWHAGRRGVPEPDPELASRNLEWVSGLQGGTHADRVAWSRDNDPGWEETERDAWAEAKARLDPRLAASGDIVPPVPWPDLVAALESHRTPALLVTGDAEGAIVTPEVLADVEEIGEAWVTTAVVEGAGHCVRRDRPAAYHALVDAWIATLLPRPTP